MFGTKKKQLLYCKINQSHYVIERIIIVPLDGVTTLILSSISYQFKSTN